MRSILQRHGGATIGAEPGPAAVFGLHPAHGDGALRAVRAAAEIRDALEPIGAMLERAGDPPIEAGVGVVIEQVGPDRGSSVSPDAAFDLAERATPGRVLLGAEAHRRAGPASVEVAQPDDGVPERGSEPVDAGTAAAPDPDDAGTAAPSNHDDLDPVAALEEALGDDGDATGDDERTETDAADHADVNHDAEDDPSGDETADAPAAEDEDGPLLLVSVVSTNAGQAPAMRAPIVGRDAERVALRELFERAVAERTCVAVTVVGSPGIGKSRLAESLISWAESSHDAAALRVRCRDAAEGEAAWPLAGLVEQALGVELGDPLSDVAASLDRLVDGEPDAPVLRERLAHVLAFPDGSAVPEETAWAMRRLLERVARDRPVIVSIDDADAADPSFARLVRSVAARVGAPVLLLATGRSDPLHGSADTNDVATLTLEPLDADGVAELLEALVGRSAFAEKAQHRVATATGGNPFLIEQLTCMLVDEGLVRWDEGRWVPTTDLSTMPTPPNVAALLDARLHALGTEEREVLERLAVAGDRLRWDGLVAALPEPVRPVAGDHVAALARKQLVRAPEAPGDDVVALQHAFVRDAAAGNASGQTRAEVHAGVAGWLEDAAADRAERYAELLGASFERAFRARSGTRDVDASARELAREAATRLDAAGRRAAELGDAHAAFQLAQRASSLVARDDPSRPDLLLRASIALADLDQLPRADALLTETAHAARSAGQRAVEWRAKILRARLAARAGSEHHVLESARRRSDRSVAVFRDLQDDWGLSWAWGLASYVSRCRGHASADAVASQRSADAARRAGRAREEVDALRELARALGDGPIPLDDVAARLAGIVDRVGDTYRPVAQDALGVLAIVQASRGRFEEARAADARAGAIVDELGLERELAVRAERSGTLSLLSGELEAARTMLGGGLAIAERIGDDAARARIAAVLAHVLEDTGDYGEAVRLTEVAEQSAAPCDVTTRVRWRTARARALAHGGNLEQANALAREAVRLADQTDAVELRATALIELAEVLRLSGRRNEAMPLVRRALRAFARKGATVRAERAQRLLGELDPSFEGVPTPGPTVDAPPVPEVERASVDEMSFANVGLGAKVAPGASVVPDVPGVGHGGAEPATGVVPAPPPGSPSAPPAPAPEPGADAAPPASDVLGDPIEREFAALDAPAPEEAPSPSGNGEGEGEKDKGRKGRKRFW